ncbi:MAG: QueT transporter family protein [Peptoniphilaceae bacterium]|nr:QueT transporter family protein [Peptoniphilaceae bacterium]MDY6085743.1 QueT transporter family protein [Peptoniphilaceae bacterium]
MKKVDQTVEHGTPHSGFPTHQVARQGIIAAVYVALTLSGLGISYGPIQFRFSEILNWLAFLDPKNVIGLTLGCFIANIPSPFGLMDMIFGTAGTLFATLLMAKTKSVWIASIWPAVFSFIYSAEALLLGQITADLYIATTASIMLSEFVIVGVIGLPVMAIVLRNERLQNAFIDPTVLPTKASWT